MASYKSEISLNIPPCPQDGGSNPQVSRPTGRAAIIDALDKRSSEKARSTSRWESEGGKV